MSWRRRNNAHKSLELIREIDALYLGKPRPAGALRRETVERNPSGQNRCIYALRRRAYPLIVCHLTPGFSLEATAPRRHTSKVANMAFTVASLEFPDSPSVQATLTDNVALSRVKSLLDIGRLLLVTAKRFDPSSRARANCLDGAKRCQSRVEEDMWKFQRPSELFQVSAGVDRLSFEIAALQ